MPQNEIQWLFFLWFAIGGIGGWVTLACLAVDAWSHWRK
jgi:hypothetical protein